MSTSFEMKEISSHSGNHNTIQPSQDDQGSISLNTLRHVDTEPLKSSYGSEEMTVDTEGEEIMRGVGSLYPDATLWGVAYVSISATGAPPPDPLKDAKKNTNIRRKSSLRRAAAATARLLGFSRSRSSHKANRTGKAVNGNDRRASYP